MKLQQKLKEYQQDKKALLACNFYNYETLRGVVNAASELQKPVILQLTKGSIDYMGLSMAVKMARTALQEYQVEGWLHLDHADDYDLISRCLDAGFDSVMIDASEKPFEENIRLTGQVVKLADSYGANVEAELGYVAKLGQDTELSGFTQPHEAKEFVSRTGVNALAVAIGSAHGFYKKKPELQLDLLSEIRNSTEAFLVLHGGSGIPDEDLQEAIERGIVKINLATEIKNIFIQTIKKTLEGTEEIDLRKIFPPATQAITELVKGKLVVVN